MIEKETLDLLEWPRLCKHLSTFAATKLGVNAALSLAIPSTLGESLELLSQTKEICSLETKVNTAWSFNGIKDIQAFLRRAALQGMLTGTELLDIASTLAGVRRLRKVIEDNTEIPTLQALVEGISTHITLEQDIYYCIDDSGDVTERASEKLASIRKSLKSYREKIQQNLQSIIQRQGNALQENLITTRAERFVLPVKITHKDQIPGIVHDTSSSGATLYIEPKAVIQLGNNLRQLARQEQREIEVVLKALTAKVASLQDDLQQLVNVATILDLATARTHYSLWLDAKPPELIDSPTTQPIKLQNLKHPLLIWQQKHEQGEKVVPINVNIKPEIRVVAITGPNTGGKTVTLKTIGLAALMAKVGLFIPAAEPVEIAWFEKILADIGDEQSIEQNLSTFSGHINRIIRILAEINQGDDLSHSLVLLDEVGAGTDPTEGSALAIALLQSLATRVWLTVATTHYGELKALKYQDSRFENASVEFDDVSLSPTYRLLWGIPGRSNALLIAQRLGLESTIIEQAKTKVGGYSEDINQVIAGLEAQRKEQEAKAQAAAQLLEETERFYGEISAKAKELQVREQELKISQEKAINEEIAAAKAEIAQVIRELQQGGQTAQKAQKASSNLAEINQAYSQKPPTKSKPSYMPKVGEKVRIPSLGQTAEVLAAPDNQGQLAVRFGIMKMMVDLTDIESLDGQKVEKPSKPPVKTSPTSPKPEKLNVRTTKNTIDIRGARVADAEIELDRAIAQNTDYQLLWIIHGKGTGKLRQGVHEFLKNHPRIASFTLAPNNEGGAGVTMAYLKV